MNESSTAVIGTPKLAASLAKAQAEFQSIAKNREVEITMKSGGRYRFRYADLETILAATRPALSKNGLAIVTEVNDGLLITTLMHESGEERHSTFRMHDSDDIKSYGAQISYLRRYAITAMLGVAADDDLDEDGQEAGRTPVPQSNGKQAQPKPIATRAAQPASLPMYPDKDFKSNLPSWRALIEDSKKTAEQIIGMISSKYELAADQIEVIKSIHPVLPEERAQ